MSAIDGVSEIFDPEQWDEVPGFEDLTDLTYHRARAHGTVRIAFDRPDVLNAFRPHTVDELLRTLEHARTSADVGCVILTGNGPSAKNGKWAFCTGGDQRIRGKAGYQYEAVDAGGAPHPPPRPGPARARRGPGAPRAPGRGARGAPPTDERRVLDVRGDAERLPRLHVHPDLDDQARVAVEGVLPPGHRADSRPCLAAVAAAIAAAHRASFIDGHRYRP
jgi:hypothetical protein